MQQQVLTAPEACEIEGCTEQAYVNLLTDIGWIRVCIADLRAMSRMNSDNEEAFLQPLRDSYRAAGQQ